MVGNTGTYLDAPFHRFEGGTDLGRSAVGAVPTSRLVVRFAGGHARRRRPRCRPTISWSAVLLHTGGDEHLGTPAYGVGRTVPDRGGRRWLTERRRTCRHRRDQHRRDRERARPAHTQLLAAGIPIVEHLTSLGRCGDRAPFTSPRRGSRYWHLSGTGLRPPPRLTTALARRRRVPRWRDAPTGAVRLGPAPRPPRRGSGDRPGRRGARRA